MAESAGDAKKNRKRIERYGIRCPVLLQTQMDVPRSTAPRGLHGMPDPTARQHLQ
jgi:hypothetical protein